MFKWLSYGNDPNSTDAFADKNYFLKREFSFTIEDDVYIRYLSFRTQKEMSDAIQKRQPHKIDIGAVYNASPKDHLTVKNFKPQERELVFDIDLTDYDDIRTTAEGTKITEKCWKFMNVAVKVLDKAIKEDFGFKHTVWIFSGRRGIHCWVCDAAARKLSDPARNAVVEYLSTVAGGDQMTQKVKLKLPLHPSLKRAKGFLEPFFEREIIGDEGQRILCEPEHWEKLLALIPDMEVQEKLKEKWQNARLKKLKSGSEESSPQEKWEQLKLMVNKRLETMAKSKVRVPFKTVESLRSCVDEIIFSYGYPRLDINVSKHQNHLLKSPFVIHPKTGRVCIPIDISQVDNFNPMTTPSLVDLFNEIDSYDREHGKEKSKNIPDIKKTSLGKYVDFFEKAFLQPLISDEKKTRRDLHERTPFLPSFRPSCLPSFRPSFLPSVLPVLLQPCHPSPSILHLPSILLSFIILPSFLRSPSFLAFPFASPPPHVLPVLRLFLLFLALLLPTPSCTSACAYC
jgi:DNA primase small subunit